MKRGGEMPIEGKQAQKLITRVPITDEPLGVAPDGGTLPPVLPPKKDAPNPHTGFDGYNPDDLIDPSRKRDAGRYR